MNAEIITIGDELLIGQVVNTNQVFIAERLHAIGIPVLRMTSVGDSVEDILTSFREAWSRQDVVLVTGGLGPTHDDITKKALCRFFGTDLVQEPGLKITIQERLAARNMSWTVAAEEQTMVPRSATIVPNPVGTAPGLVFQRDGKVMIAMPGVPYEMEAIVEGSIIPFLATRVTDRAIVHRVVRTTGIAESTLAERLGDISGILEGASLAFLPSTRGVRLRITVDGTDRRAAEEHAGRVISRIRERAARFIYAEDDIEIEQVIGTLLSERGLTVAVAESCTGGLITDRLTDVPGSSRYFERGVVAYSNRAKSEILGVPPEAIEVHGAVSAEVARAMAEGVRRIARTDFGISTTGIAGPGGGSDRKPVGLVWLGVAETSGSRTVQLNLGADRRRTKERASQAALDLLRRALLGLP